MDDIVEVAVKTGPAFMKQAGAAYSVGFEADGGRATPAGFAGVFSPITETAALNTIVPRPIELKFSPENR